MCDCWFIYTQYKGISVKDGGRLVAEPNRQHDAGDPSASIYPHSTSGDFMVCLDFLHIVGHKCISTIRNSVLGWTLRKRVLPSHDRKP
jgi:hypothetical protein